MRVELLAEDEIARVLRVHPDRAPMLNFTVHLDDDEVASKPGLKANILALASSANAAWEKIHDPLWDGIPQ